MCFLPILQLQRQGTGAVLVTVAAARGSIPTIVGNKIIVTAEGLHSGTIGGGKIEARAVEHAVSLLPHTGRSPIYALGICKGTLA